jgi:hypothetical protein
MQQHLEKAYLLQSQIKSNCDLNKLDDMYKTFDDINALYTEMNNICDQIKIIRHNSKMHIMQQLSLFKKEMEMLSLNNLTRDELLLLEPSKVNVEFEAAPNINLPAIKVLDECHIPNVPLYYLENEKAFAIKISGTVLKGQIGNIYSGCKKYLICTDKHHIDFDHVGRCAKRHPDLNEPIGWNPSCFNTVLNEPIKPNNRYMRHIGNRDTLEDDILYKLDDKEQLMRSQQ